MRTAACALLMACALPGGSAAAQLTLDEALATADAPHPELRIAQSELALARADRELATGRRDFSLFLDGSLRSGRRPDSGTWEPDNVARIVARKPVLDFGRTRHAVEAADREVSAQAAQLIGAEHLRRIDIMACYFDVLLADMQYAADNESMAVAYVTWDNAKDRFALGQISRPQLLQLEADYQNVRERRNASQQQMRSARQRLAHAMNRPGSLPDELVEPILKENERLVPEYASLLPWVMAKNPRVVALQAQVAAAEARLAAVRSEGNPVLEAELIGGGYSRETETRDQVGAGLVFNIPLYQGARLDAGMARELARKERAAAELDKLRFELSDALLATLQEIEWLRDSGRPAATKQIEYRDWALERARAEYELEMTTNLGDSMAQTQLAKLRKKRVEYRLALALARLQAMCGGALPPAIGERI